MAGMGLKLLVRPKKYRSYRGEVGRSAPNLLQRKFSADRANRKWVTDVKEFSLAGDKLYLSSVMDLYNGEIVAFETARRPRFKLVPPFACICTLRPYYDRNLLNRPNLEFF